MPDFLLDTRPPERRPSHDVAGMLRWSDRLRVQVWDRPQFRLIATWSEPDPVWAPAQDPDGTLCAVTGFLALEEEEWARAEKECSGGTGSGWAARAVLGRYRAAGTQAWDDLSGNCAILLYDADSQTFHLRTDPAGCFPVFWCSSDGYPVWASHPDVLAGAVDRTHRLDEVSLAEFVQTSMVTPPYTYYQGIQACESGMVFTWQLRTGRMLSRRYFNLEYDPDPRPDVEACAEELAEAWKTAVRRRTLPRLGRPAIALSGGLDSRLILACTPEPARAVAFTCYDAPNRELHIARAIAQAAGAEFKPLQRPPDYYGENAPKGVRIAGGMGTFANNHFLGILDSLPNWGTTTLLTGCYCDYLFKGLPLNRRVRAWDGRETLAPYRHEFYFQHWTFDTPLARQVWQRWETRFPPELRERQDDESLFRIEALRTFPLYHEGDNQQRLVPQRYTAWSPPVTDLGVLRVYRSVPSRFKLNRDLFLRTARRLLAGSPVRDVPDANTGVAVHAPPWLETLSWQWLRVKRKLRSLRSSLSSDGSWPNWTHYYRHSPSLDTHWRTVGPDIHDLILRVTGWKTLPDRPSRFPPEKCFLIVAILTLKLWWQYRPCSGASPS